MCVFERTREREREERISESYTIVTTYKLDCKLIQRRNNVDFPFICFVRKVQKTRQTNKKYFATFFKVLIRFGAIQVIWNNILCDL